MTNLFQRGLMTATAKNLNVLPLRRYNYESFLGVEDHTRVMQMGNLFSKYLVGKSKFFSFYSPETVGCSQASIVGLSSFINYYHQRKVTVFIDSYTEAWKQALPCEESAMGSLDCVKVSGGIELVEIRKLKNLCERSNNSFELMLEQIIHESEVIFWEMSPESIQDREAFLLLWKNMEAVSIWVNQNRSKSSELRPFIEMCQSSNKDVISFFMVKP